MKILITGAGIGGLALAALLRQKGIIPTVIERAKDFSHAGYMLGLFPIGSRILHGLGLFDRFKEISQSMDFYDVRNGHGDLVHHYDFSELVKRFGYIGQLKRAELLDLLVSGCKDVPIRMNTALESYEQKGDKVIARLSDGTAEEVDLLVGADGIHSQTRRTMLGVHPDHETGWGCWVWWADKLKMEHNTVTEYWGTGLFLGVYPTKNSIGVVGGGPLKSIGPKAIGTDGKKLREIFSSMQGGAKEIIAQVPDDLTGLFFWTLSDYRAEKWHDGRVALCGDSGCAFLPTAGIGASMALESAAVLADELGRTDAGGIPHALSLYQKRRKKRAEGAQDDSRGLAKMMFTESTPLAWTRDQFMKYASIEMLAKNIAKSLDEPI